MTLYPTDSPCLVDADEILDDLLDHLEEYQDHGLLPGSIAADDLTAISAEIARWMDESAEPISRLVSLDEDFGGDVLVKKFRFPLGGPRCIVYAEVSNLGDFINGLVHFDFCKED